MSNDPERDRLVTKRYQLRAVWARLDRQYDDLRERLHVAGIKLDRIDAEIAAYDAKAKEAGE